MHAQHTIGWYRSRLGMFTGSKISALMSSGKKELFSDTGISYIYEIAAERCINADIVNDDELFSIYIDQTEITSKAMRWGTEQEAKARSIYEKLTGCKMLETGFINCKEIKTFGSSPDGFYCSNDGSEIGTLEIKCPNTDTFYKYSKLITDNNSLFATNSKYFYQCQSHMLCLDAKWCDFMVYNPFMTPSTHIVRIIPDKDVFKAILSRIEKAEEFILNI